MSGINGRQKPTLDDRLGKAQQRLQLMETNARLRQARMIRRHQRKLRESSEAWEWMSGYSDILDRLRETDREFSLPVSTATDIRYGDNFPFWRTWVEHARLRAASRLIYGMSGLVRGAVRGVGCYVIGEGMRTRAMPRRADSPPELVSAVQSWLDEWEKDNDWPARQREAFHRHQRDGEYFLRVFPQDDGWTLTRFVDPTQVVDAPGMPAEVGKYGVIVDPEDLEDVRGIWVAYDGLPGNGEEVPSSEIRLRRANVDRGVKRGMPTVSYDTLDLFKLTARLLENMGTGSAIQAAIAFARQHEIAPGSAVSDFVGGLAAYDQAKPYGSGRENVQMLRAGTVIDMDAGQKFVETSFSSNVQNFVACVQAMLRAVAVAWNAPEWITSADNSSVNYASSLTSESQFVKACKAAQGEFAADFTWAVDSALKHFCRVKQGLRVNGKLWTHEAVAHYVQIQVTPPTVETRNRSEEATLNREYITLGVKSRQTAAQELGLDYEREERNNEDFEKKHGEQGVPAKERAGEGGGGPDDPDAASVRGTPQVTRQPQQPGQMPAGMDDLLAAAGLGGGDDTQAAPEATPDAPAAGNDLRATVGGLQALKDLQAAVYGGELPREAAVANAKLMLGFSDEEAASLFPPAKPVKTADEGQGQQPGAPGVPTLESRRPPSLADELVSLLESEWA